ncbi:TetR/AcrR family transcriptional regulator [Lichenicoccus sp.]|uniref:TetR/AcrR family transcriptional regulator n=1 Tax=Lichenicoccus sp. TaxID=2781899 RepID=UPI003D0DC535
MKAAPTISASRDAARLPEDATARTRILDAAEEFFSEYGFDGTSLRQIALRAGVPAGLIGYHFTGKLGLYCALFESRTPSIVEQRNIGLALAELEDDPDRRLELILKAVLVPMLRMTSQDSGSRFGLLLAREVSDPRSSERGIVEKMLDPIAVAVTDQLRTLLPKHSEAEIHWAYHTIVGAMTYMMLDSGRIVRLSKGAADPRNVDAMIRHLTALLLKCLQGPPALLKDTSS